MGVVRAAAGLMGLGLIRAGALLSHLASPPDADDDLRGARPVELTERARAMVERGMRRAPVRQAAPPREPLEGSIEARLRAGQDVAGRGA